MEWLEVGDRHGANAGYTMEDSDDDLHAGRYVRPLAGSFWDTLQEKVPVFGVAGEEGGREREESAGGLVRVCVCTFLVG